MTSLFPLRWERLPLLLALFGLFFYFGVGIRSIPTLFALCCLLIVSLAVHSRQTHEVLWPQVTVYLPFVLLLGGLSVFQTDTHVATQLLGVVLIYFLARTLRGLLPLNWILFGMATSATLVGIVRIVGTSEYRRLIPLLEDIAGQTSKNPTGWTLAFGIVAAGLIAMGAVTRRWRAGVVWIALPLVMLVILIRVDSMGSLLAVGLSALALTVTFVVILLRKGPLRTLAKAAAISSSIALGAVGLTVAITNWFARGSGLLSSGDSDAGLLQRDFTNLTGRTRIWSCYFKFMDTGPAVDVWERTVRCSRFGPSHLHNIFLESHLLGSYPLAIVVLAGVVAAIVVAFFRAIRATEYDDLVDALFALGVGVVGLVVGMVESYVYYPVLFGALALFLGPRPHFSRAKARHESPVGTG